MKLICGNANVELGHKIAGILETPPINCQVTRFADAEIFVSIEENVRGGDVFVLQSTSNPVNDNLMELLIILDALKRASPRRITAVIPYFGYARQDRKSAPRTPISAKLVADLIVCAGAHRVLTMDLHAGQIQGFFNIPVDNLFARPVIREDIEAHYMKPDAPLVIVSPDVGGLVRARALASRLGAGLAIIDKRRERPGQSEVMHVIGNVEGSSCIIVDDIVDSGGTLCNGAAALLAHGAREVCAYITHGVLSGTAHEKIERSKLKELVITDSIAPTVATKTCEKIRIVSIAPLMARAIEHTFQEYSVSSLFD